jgi:hypothetical protein
VTSHRAGLASRKPGVDPQLFFPGGESGLDWGDVVLFGTSTRFGNPASQLRAFINTTGPLWAQGELASKAYSAPLAGDVPRRRGWKRCWVGGS